VFGLEPARHEVAVKSRLAYVPDTVAFYPWMTVRDTLDYFASFRAAGTATPSARCWTSSGSMPPEGQPSLEGQRTQLALITAICPEPELLVLDEPTSGSIRSSAASSSRPSSAPIRTASPGGERCSSRLT
jgi:ABC-type multidrug transport system ATPase subunit